MDNQFAEIMNALKGPKQSQVIQTQEKPQPSPAKKQVKIIEVPPSDPLENQGTSTTEIGEQMDDDYDNLGEDDQQEQDEVDYE